MTVSLGLGTATVGAIIAEPVLTKNTIVLPASQVPKIVGVEVATVAAVPMVMLETESIRPVLETVAVGEPAKVEVTATV